MDFDLTIHPDEIEAIMQVRLDQLDEANRMLEAFKQIFIQDVTNAWNNYVDRTVVTVQQEAELHRKVVEDSINYLWDGSAFPGQSLDDIYPRPAVAFAARNKVVSKSEIDFNRRDATIFVVAALSFAAMLTFYKQKEKSAAKVLFQEEPVELDVKKARKSKVNIFKKKTEKEKSVDEERKNMAEPLL